MKSTTVRSYRLQGATYASRLIRPMSVRRAKEWLKQTFKMEVLPDVEFF